MGAPWARARSEGFHDAMNGTVANAAPTAPVAIVARVRNLRRLRSTSSSPTTASSAIQPSPISSRCAHRADEAWARAISYLAGGGALYTNVHPSPGAPCVAREEGYL